LRLNFGPCTPPSILPDLTPVFQRSRIDASVLARDTQSTVTFLRFVLVPAFDPLSEGRSPWAMNEEVASKTQGPKWMVRNDFAIQQENCNGMA